MSSSSKPVAIVLGGTNPHAELCRNLKQRGYHTVLVDYYENPPAKAAADEHIRESTLDKDKVLEIAKEINASLVISTCIDQANVTACYVAEKLGLPRPYSYATALIVSDKHSMKQIMIENAIPTPAFCCRDASSSHQLEDLVFPVVIKPADGTGSKAVRKADNSVEAKSYFHEALQVSRNGKVILEEYIEGVELSVDCLVEDGCSRIILIRQKFGFRKGGGDPVLQCYASLCPAVKSNKLRADLERVVNQISEAFHLKNTSLLVQVLVRKDEIFVIEFAPRVGGGLSFRTVELAAGYNILDYTIDSFLGTPVAAKGQNSSEYFLTINLYCKSCVFERISGADALINEGVIYEIYYYKTRGMIIDFDMSARSRAGAMIIKGSRVQEINNKLNMALNNLQILDAGGNDLFIRDIYAGYLEPI